MLELFAIAVLLCLLLSGVALIILLGAAPGHFARKRGHPYADAVTVAGWVGVVFIMFWPFALVWAFVDWPKAAPASGTDWNDLRRRLSHVENQLHLREAAE
jgi:hypothetical protein